MKTGKHKIASIVLLMIFLSQQISWACGYNLSLLVNPPPSSLIYKDHGEFNLWVARRVYSLTKPSFRHNPQDLKSAYQWLKQPATETVPCSAYVLYNLLQAKGIKPKIEDISASLISLDLKAGNLKPPFTASRIDNSLYAMAKTSESQGLALYPSRLNLITSELLNSQTPFIAHLSYGGLSGHFVLVTKIDTEKVYFFYDKGDTFLPVEKFLEEFSGYCLLSSASVGIAQCAVPTIADSEAKTILGAGRSYHGRSVNISSLFKKPSTMESVIGIAAAFGGAFSMGGSGYGSLAAAGIKIGGSMIFKDSQWGQIGTSIVAGAVGGGINGGMAGGWKEGLQGAGVGAAKSATISGTMYGISQVKIGNLSPSVMASIGQLVAVPLGNAVGRGLQMGLDLPLYDGSGNRLGTVSELKLNGGFGTGFWQGLTFQTPENGKTGFRDKWGMALQHYGSETASIAVEVFAPGKYSSAYGMGINSAFSVFTNTNDSWGKAVGISIGKGVAMGGASLLLANLTKDMRVTEGAFLEKAASSLVGAGVESIFGYNKAEFLTPTSRWGIFSKSLTDNWVNTSKSIVTFGNPSGNFLNYQGSYAIAKMHTFGSDIAALQEQGLESFDAVRYAWNQYVGSSLHYSAIGDFASIAENRMRGVTYINEGKEMHKIEMQSLKKFTNDKDLLKSGGRTTYDLTAQKYMPQTFTYDDQTSGIVKSITIGEGGFLPADYSKEDAEFLEIEQKYFESKINSLNDTKLPQEDFMIRYPMVSEELEKTVVFSPQQKVVLRQDLKKVSDASFKRFSALGRDYAKEYNYTPQSDEDILNAELDYMTKKIQKFDGTKGNYDRISKDIETSVIFKPQEKEAFRMGLGMAQGGGNSNAQTTKAEEANKRDYAKEYNYTPQSDADILNAEQDYLKNKIAKANQEIYKLNDNIVYGQEDKKGLNDAYDKIYGKISQEIKNTMVFSPDDKKGLGIGKFEPIEQGLDMAGSPEWKVGNKDFNSIDKAKEYQKNQRMQQPAILPNSSPTPNVTPTVVATSAVAPARSPSPTPVPTPSPDASATAAATASPTPTPAASPTPEPTPTSQEIKNALSGVGQYTNGWQNLANQIATSDNVSDADYIKLEELQQNDYHYLSGTSNENPSAAMIMISSKENKTVSSNVNKPEESQKNNQVLSEDEAEKVMARATEGIFIEPGDSNIAAEINSKGPDAVKNRLTGVRSGVNHGEKWVEHIPSGKADKTDLIKITTYDPELKKVVELEIGKDKLLDRPGQGLSNSSKNDVAVVDSEGNQKYVDAEDLKSGINKADARSESKYRYSTIDMGKDKEPLTQKITVTDKGRIIERFNGKGETVFKLDLVNQKVVGKAEDKRDYAKEYNYTPQSDEDILNAELDYMTKKIQKFDGTKGNYDRISKDIETSVIFKPQEKEAFRMGLGMAQGGGNSNAQTTKAEEANKRDYAKEYNYTPQSDEDILKAEQDYLKNKIAKANQEIDKFNDNIVYGQADKNGLNDAYDKIHGKISQEIKNTVVFNPDEKEKLGISKFEPIEQGLDMGGSPEWKVGDKDFNSIEKAREYQNKQRVRQPAVSANSGSAVPKIVEYKDDFNGSQGWKNTQTGRFYRTKEAAEKDLNKSSVKAPATPEPTASQAVTPSATPTVAPATTPSLMPVPTPSPAASATAAATASPTVEPAASPTPEPTPTPQSAAQQQPTPVPVPTANWEYTRDDDGKITGLTIDLSGKKLNVPYSIYDEVEDVKIREVNTDTVKDKDAKKEPKVYISFKNKDPLLDYRELLTIDPGAGNIVKKERIYYDEIGKEQARIVNEKKILPSSEVEVSTEMVIDENGNLLTEPGSNDLSVFNMKKAWDPEAKEHVPYHEFIDKNKRRNATVTPAQNVALTPPPVAFEIATATSSPTLTPAASPTPEPTATLQLPVQTTSPQPTATPKATGGDYFKDVFYDLKTDGKVTTFVNQNTGNIDRVVTKHEDGTFEVDDKVNNEKYNVIQEKEDWSLTKKQFDNAGLYNWDEISNKLIDSRLAYTSSFEEIEFDADFDKVKEKISNDPDKDYQSVLPFLQQSDKNRKVIYEVHEMMLEGDKKVFVYKNSDGMKIVINYGRGPILLGENSKVNIEVYDQNGKEMERIDGFGLDSIGKRHIEMANKNLSMRDIMQAKNNFNSAIGCGFNKYGVSSMAKAVERFIKANKIMNQ